MAEKYVPWSFVSVANLAVELDLAPKTIRRLCADGVFEYIEFGNKWLIDRASVEKWIELKKAHTRFKTRTVA